MSHEKTNRRRVPPRTNVIFVLSRRSERRGTRPKKYYPPQIFERLTGVGRGKGELDDENIENDGAETTRERQIETNGDGHAVFLSGSSANRDRATSENRKRTPAGPAGRFARPVYAFRDQIRAYGSCSHVRTRRGTV